MITKIIFHPVSGRTYQHDEFAAADPARNHPLVLAERDLRRTAEELLCCHRLIRFLRDHPNSPLPKTFRLFFDSSYEPFGIEHYTHKYRTHSVSFLTIHEEGVPVMHPEPEAI